MISLELLQLFVYLSFMISIIAYATLDGFDLGVGALHLFVKGDSNRRLMINSIGPVWDGNTTWIVVGGGILFAAFPKVFANLSSSLYLPTMLLLFGYMLRGVAIEFRSKKAKRRWRSFWDLAFFSASLLLSLMVGILLGNLIQGLPLNAEGEYLQGMLPLLNPYALLVSVFGSVMFMMHGSIYILMKTEGELHATMQAFAKRLIWIFLFFWIFTTTATFYFSPHMFKPFSAYPLLCLFPFLSLGCIAGTLYCLFRQKDGWTFTFSCFSIVFLLSLFAIGTFPNLVYSTVSPETYSLTLYNSSSSKISLIVMAIVALLGIPLGFFYGSYIYRVFKGKVKIDSRSY